jgi:hypothetical protein
MLAGRISHWSALKLPPEIRTKFCLLHNFRPFAHHCLRILNLGSLVISRCISTLYRFISRYLCEHCVALFICEIYSYALDPDRQRGTKSSHEFFVRSSGSKNPLFRLNFASALILFHPIFSQYPGNRLKFKQLGLLASPSPTPNGRGMVMHTVCTCMSCKIFTKSV